MKFIVCCCICLRRSCYNRRLRWLISRCHIVCRRWSCHCCRSRWSWRRRHRWRLILVVLCRAATTTAYIIIAARCRDCAVHLGIWRCLRCQWLRWRCAIDVRVVFGIWLLLIILLSTIMTRVAAVHAAILILIFDAIAASMMKMVSDGHQANLMVLMMIWHVVKTALSH